MEAMTLDVYDIAILAKLSEDSGYTTGALAKAMGSHVQMNRRRYSQAIRGRILEMKDAGFVAYLDAEKPVAWVRTAKGTAALEARGKVKP